MSKPNETSNASSTEKVLDQTAEQYREDRTGDRAQNSMGTDDAPEMTVPSGSEIMDDSGTPDSTYEKQIDPSSEGSPESRPEMGTQRNTDINERTPEIMSSARTEAGTEIITDVSEDGRCNIEEGERGLHGEMLRPSEREPSLSAEL